MKLICIGDSLTFGYGVRPSQRWTRLCAQETGWEIVNEGISGDTTGGMLVRLRALLAERDICVQRPLVLLMGGANDIFFSGTDTGARANMGAMLNQLLSLGVHNDDRDTDADLRGERTAGVGGRGGFPQCGTAAGAVLRMAAAL